MAEMTTRPWNGSAARFSDAEYRRSCLIKGPTKAECHLPVREPDGTVNCRAVAAAKAAVSGGRGGVGFPVPASVRSRLDSLSAACERARNPMGVRSGMD